MTISWTNRARRQLHAIFDALLQENPQAAARVYTAIEHSVARLTTFPDLGRPGRVPGTRELVIPDLPYIVPYRRRGDTIEILAVFHGARRWPERF